MTTMLSKACVQRAWGREEIYGIESLFHDCFGFSFQTRKILELIAICMFDTSKSSVCIQLKFWIFDSELRVTLDQYKLWSLFGQNFWLVWFQSSQNNSQKHSIWLLIYQKSSAFVDNLIKKICFCIFIVFIFPIKQ